MADELLAGRYRIHDELGRGASATVYRAHDTVLERFVALKVISSGLASDPDFGRRFEQEARLVARLDHPNVVLVHDFGTLADGRAFIAMRLLEGPGLDALLTQRGQLAPAEVVSIINQLAAALDYTHSIGMVHRDVKPSNVKVDNAGRATLTDFGIARALDSARVTLPGLTIGTPRYMSPEQVRGEDTTSATDIYSLAVMAYEMMAGRPPFEGDGTSLMYKIVHETPPPPTSFNPWLPASISAAIEKGLAKSPVDRWNSAGEFAAALSEALATSTLGRAALPAGAVAPAVAASAIETGGVAPIPIPIPGTEINTGSGPAEAPTQVHGTGGAPVLHPSEEVPTQVASTGGGPALSSPVVAQTQTSSTGGSPVLPPPTATVPADEKPDSASPPQALAAPPPKDPEARRRTGVLLGGAAAAFVVGAIGIGVFAFGGGGGDPKSSDDKELSVSALTATASAASAGTTPTGLAKTASPSPSGTGQASATPTNPPAATEVPPTQAPGSTAVVPPPATATKPPAAATATPVPPTATSVPPTATSVPPTATTLPPTATATTNTAKSTFITGITVNNGQYVISFVKNNLSAAAGEHVHFFFDTVTQAQAGTPGNGPWKLYYGDLPFTGWGTHEKPAAAKQMCILVANANHSIQPNTGNCWALPPS